MTYHFSMDLFPEENKGEEPPPPPPVRNYPSATTGLDEEHQPDTFPLGFMTLRVYYVGLVDPDIGHGYWTWSIGTHVGEGFRTKAEAKWDAAKNAYPMVAEAADTLKTIYDKAVKRASKSPR